MPKPAAKKKQAIIADSLTMGIAFALVLTVIQRGVGFVRSILFCRYLPEDELGSFSLAWSFLMLLAPIAVLALPGTFGRYVEYFRQRGQLKSFLKRIGLISLLMTGSCVAALVLFAPAFAQLFFRNSSQTTLVWSLAIALLLVGASNFFSCLVESLRQVRLATWMRFISGVAFAIAALFLMFFWQRSASAVTIGFGISCLIGIVPAIWFLTRNWNHLEDATHQLGQRNMWSKIAPFAAWLWLSNLATNMYEVSDRYMLLQCLPMSAEDAQAIIGQYHSARVVPLLLVSLAAVLGSILLPYMSAAWEEKRFKDAKVQLSWTLKLVGLSFSFAGVMVILFSPFLFNVVLQGRYGDGLAILPMTLTYCIWYSIAMVSLDYLWVRDKGKFIFLSISAGLIVNIVLNFLLIPAYGLNGAVWATVASNVACLLLILIFNQRLGFRNDRGIWIAVFSPLVVLLPVWAGLIVISTTIYCGLRYRWIFSEEEAEKLSEFANKLWQRTPLSHLSLFRKRVKSSF